MKNQTFKIIAIITLLLSVSITSAVSQTVTPNTSGVKFFCHDAANLDLGTPPASGPNPRWIVRHSTTPLVIANIGATSPITLTGNSIPASALTTGYLYISAIDDVNCESEPEVVPIYKFAALTASITGATDYCEESPKTFTATATSSDSHVTFAYQWYTTDGSTDTPIVGQTSSTFKPTGILAGTTTQYKVKIGYLVNTAKYCSNTSTQVSVAVTAKPTKPTITVEGISGETW